MSITTEELMMYIFFSPSVSLAYLNILSHNKTYLCCFTLKSDELLSKSQDSYITPGECT